MIHKQLEIFSKQFDSWLESYLSSQAKKSNYVDTLWQSKAYSLRSGGKRFRPFLASLIFKIWNQDTEKIKSFCLAIEMIHTYSLIHDDLPSMDNDDFRRGKPTNHKIYGEAIALLAGDALLTEAFQVVSDDQSLTPQTCVSILRLLSQKVGSFGMVGGQVLDMQSTESITPLQLEKIHHLKTGYLIQVAAQGSALIANASSDDLKKISDFALNLGLAFQIKDDLLDADDKQQDYKSYVTLLGKEKAIEQLEKKSEDAKKLIASFAQNQNLIELVHYNLQRIS